MNFSRLFKLAYSVIKGYLTGGYYPVFVTWSATNRCQANCSYCNINERSNTEMTTDQVKNLIDEITGLGCQRFGIWGGEPLVRDDIGEVIDYASSRGLFVTLTTNGYEVPAKIELIKNLDILMISIDGYEKTHDANRGRGSFIRALGAIKTARKARLRTLTSTVLTKHNCNEESIDYILDLADSYNLASTFQILHHHKELGDSITLKPDDKVYREIIKYVFEQKKKGRRVGTSYKALNHLLKWGDYSAIRKSNSKNRCHAGKFFANIDTDGALYPCCLLINDTSSGNCIKKGYRQALKKMAKPTCTQCAATFNTEYNLLFNLDISTIFEWMSFLGKKPRKRRLDVKRIKKDNPCKVDQ